MKDLSKKEKVYFQICDAVLYMETMKPHLKWSLSDISKQSGVTRSLIYYYLGKEKDQILHEAVLFMLDLFFNISGNRKLGLEKRMEVILEKISEMPHIFLFYISERVKESEYGQTIREAEQKLISYLQSELGLSEKEALSLFMLEIGACAFGLKAKRAKEFFSSK